MWHLISAWATPITPMESDDITYWICFNQEIYHPTPTLFFVYLQSALVPFTGSSLLRRLNETSYSAAVWPSGYSILENTGNQDSICPATFNKNKQK